MAGKTQAPLDAAFGLKNGMEMQPGTFRHVLRDVFVLGTLKQLVRGVLIHLTVSCGRSFLCARRVFFPADHKLQRKKSV